MYGHLVPRVFLLFRIYIEWTGKITKRLWAKDLACCFLLYVYLDTWRDEQNFKLFCIVLMSSILISNLHMRQAKKALHFLPLKLVLKTVRLLQICM